MLSNKLRDVILYFCQHVQNSDILSKARVAKMVYLADWRSSIVHGSQITNLTWRYNHYGPYVREIENVARSDPAFELEQSVNLFGDDKTIIRAKDGYSPESLTDDDKSVLEHVIRETSELPWTEFIRLVYSTYPVLMQERGTALNLPALAERYAYDRKRFGWDQLADEDSSPVRVVTS